MKLSQYKEKKNHKKIIAIALVIVGLIGGIILDKTFANFKAQKSFKVMEGNFIYEGSGDITLAFYHGDEPLTKMPVKNNEENLGFEKAICDNGASVEWNEEKWSPLITNLTVTKTKCTLYFAEIKKIDISKDIPLAKDGQDGLFAVEHNNLTSLDIIWNKTEYRYAGKNPNNYVSFNGEIWRIIGLVNVKATNGYIEQRLKIIRTNGIEGQKDFGNYAWDRGPSDFNSNWTTSKLKDMLNGIYYNSGSGECYSGSIGSTANKSTCDFSGNGSLPKGLDEEARKMIDSEVMWNIGTTERYSLAEMFYEGERGTNTAYNNSYPHLWTNDDATFHNGIGLMYASDYGYASHGGAMGRTSCLKKELSSWKDNNYQTDCANNDWLKPSSGAVTSLSPSSDYFCVFGVRSDGYVDYFDLDIDDVYSTSYAYSILPVVYLASRTIIYDGDGSISNPFKLKFI